MSDAAAAPPRSGAKAFIYRVSAITASAPWSTGPGGAR